MCQLTFRTFVSRAIFAQALADSYFKASRDCRSGFTIFSPVSLQEQPAMVLLLEGLRSDKVLVIREYGGHKDLRGSSRRSVIPYVYG
jgi:hypothetical protein